MERHTNYTTVNVTWKPKLNDSRADYYCYQLIESLTQLLILISNTSHTAVELSIPHDINTSFVISAHNCAGRSLQSAILLN